MLLASAGTTAPLSLPFVKQAANGLAEPQLRRPAWMRRHVKNAR